MIFAEKTPGANAVYLVQLLHGLMEYGCARGAKSFPMLFSRPWHDLLYALKQKHPAEFNSFVFLESGSDKISADIDNATHGLIFICDERCDDHRILLKPDILPVKDSRFFSGGQNFDEMVAVAFDIAAKTDGFLEY